MNEWFGKIKIGEISTVQAGSPGNETPFTEMKENNVRFVHYPDCQQLIIWLTHPGSEYNYVRLRNKNTQVIIEEWPVKDHLNGSIQLLWDTLTIAPGNYIIEIDWKNGWQHHIEFVKEVEGSVEEIKEPDVIVNSAEKTAAPILYRDGFGKIIENEDLAIQEKLKKQVFSKFTRRIEYDGNFRAGNIVYIDGDTRIKFSHEMGGGNCMCYIDIPTAGQWEAQTKTPLSGRKEILEFVARTVNSEQASNCRFEITDDSITYYYR